MDQAMVESRPAFIGSGRRIHQGKDQDGKGNYYLGYWGTVMGREKSADTQAGKIKPQMTEAVNCS
jgi:hypothetical protein